MFEIAFLLDANISSDMLSQVQMLAQGLKDSSHFRARLVLFGPVDKSSAIARCWPDLGSSGEATFRELKIHCLPRPRGPGLLDVLSLAHSQALAGCSLLHCFSLSLLDTLVSLSAKKMLPALLLSLSASPGKQVACKLAQWCSSPSRRVICFTSPLQEDLIAAGVPAERCSVILPEPPTLRKAPDRLTARKQLGLSEDLDILVAAPEISYSSHHRQLTWAAAIIGQVRPGLRVLVAGCDARLTGLRAFDDSLNPPSLGIYPNEKFEPQVLYAASDLLVLPATEAICPLPLLRAGQTHLPVVASDSQAFRQYLHHERNALLFSPNQHSPGNRTCRRIRPLATTIVRALEDRSLSQRLAEQLAQDLNSSFPSGRFLPAHLELYQQILGQGRL